MGRLLRFDELAFECDDLLGVIELDEIERLCGLRVQGVETTSTCGYHSTMMCG